MKKVDVIVVARNEENAIGATLKSINSQTIGSGVSLRVQVIVNGCTDRTPEVARDVIAELEKRSDINFELQVRIEGGKSKSLNYALGRGTAPIVFCTDSDVTFSPDCFKRVLKMFDNPKIRLSGAEPTAVVDEALDGTLLGDLYRVRRVKWALMGGQIKPRGRMLAFRRSDIDSYPMDFVGAEDTWVVYEIALMHGWEAVKIAPEAFVYAKPPQDWLDLIQQESRWQLNYLRLMRYFPHMAQVDAQLTKITLEKLALLIERQDAIRDRLVKAGIAFEALAMDDALQRITRDNAALMGSKLAREDGTWQPIASTKSLSQAEPVGRKVRPK